MDKCDNCREKIEDGLTFVEAGEQYVFCKPCSEVVEHMPTGATIQNLLRYKVSWNIAHARARRAKGQVVWGGPAVKLSQSNNDSDLPLDK